MLIGLSGPLGAGKSLAAKLLSVHYGVPIVPLAAPLKAMLETLGVPPVNLYGTPAQKAEPLAMLGGRSAREAMQTLGTEWGRQCVDEGLWRRAWLAKVGTRAIADDVRFTDEAEMIRARGGIVVRVIRDAAEHEERRRLGVLDHASENYISVRPDVTVINDKCPTILRERLIGAVESARVAYATAEAL
jgi:hypothetical protein